MEVLYQLYDAYSGMSPIEKGEVIRFLTENEGKGEQDSIRESVEYAMKLKPSFGGFVLIASHKQQIVGAIVANRTGMEAYNPKNIFVFVTISKKLKDQGPLVKELIDKAVRYADGDIAMHVKSDNPALTLYREMGFKAQYLELRLANPHSSSAVAS